MTFSILPILLLDYVEMDDLGSLVFVDCSVGRCQFFEELKLHAITGRNRFGWRGCISDQGDSEEG